jgi:hypothetical protein
MIMPGTANMVVAALNYMVLLMVLLLMLRDARRTQSWLPLFCLLGGCVAFLMEPIYDMVGSVWYPQHGQTPLFRAFNYSIPAWMLPAYAWFIAGQGYWMYKKFQVGVSIRQLWRYYALFWLSNLLLEVPGLTLGIYAYYGAQPFKLFGFPLWMAMTNALMPILLGVTFVSLRTILTGGRVWITTPLVPMVIGFAQIAAGWPTWLALNSGQGLLMTHAAATVSLGLSLLIVYLVSQKFCSESLQPATPHTQLSRG